MSPRERKSGKLLLDTGEFRALTDEVVEAARDELAEGVRAELRDAFRDAGQPSWPSTPRPSDSGEALRKFIQEQVTNAYATMRDECVARGPIATLRKELQKDMKELDVTVTKVLNEQATARGKELARVQFVGWIIAILSGAGALFNIIWTLLKASSHG